MALSNSKLEYQKAMHNKIIITIILIGVFYRLVLTAGGNFLFNMDNARDMVDVREMIVLSKPRLIGPTSAIEGFYNGPFWYYLLAVPFMLSGGDPYASIIMEIVLWAIGGFFLLKLISKWGTWLILPIGIIWVSSNYIVLTNLYAFNPNPVTLLAPLFIYLLVQYLKSGKAVYGIFTWFLAGLFFNFEMNFGIFTPIIITVNVILTKNFKLLKQKWFWLGFTLFVMTLLPQVIFDLRHQHIMAKAILRYLAENSGAEGFNILIRFQGIVSIFYNTFLPTMMNHKTLTWIILGLLFFLGLEFLKKKNKEILVLVSTAFIMVPFFGYLILPVAVNPWHLGGEMAVSLILIAYLFKMLLEGNFFRRVAVVFLAVSIMLSGLLNITNFFMNDFGKVNLDPSLYKNEIAAIDYVYKYANGQNFKVYAYLPSVYDYPYQYLIWWHGLKKFGYLPIDYAYAPNKPQLISNKQYFSATSDSLNQRRNSNLVFLIEEPNYRYTRFGWEGDFVKLPSIEKKMVGPLEIDIRQEVSQY